MWEVDLKLLSTAIKKAPAFKYPEMDEGSKYIYDKIYAPLARGEKVCMSGLDFDAFDLDDIIFFTEKYGHELQERNYQAGNISYSLHQIPAASRTVSYV